MSYDRRNTAGAFNAATITYWSPARQRFETEGVRFIEIPPNARNHVFTTSTGARVNAADVEAYTLPEAS